MDAKILVLTNRSHFWEALESTFRQRHTSILTCHDLEDGLSILKGEKIPLNRTDGHTCDNGAQNSPFPMRTKGNVTTDASGSTQIPLVILDLSRDGGEIRSAVFQILSVNALIHTCATTDRNAEEFHEAMEGLGMLPPLPADPKENDISALLDALEQLNGPLE